MKMNTMLLLLAGVGIVAGIGWKLTARGAYESAEYTVEMKDGEFEIRIYPDLTVASTEMQIDAAGKDGSFMRLFRYIAGGNAAKEKIAMTTPVFMQRESGTGHGQMSFVLPKDVAAASTPQPTEAGVSLQRRKSGRFAVFRFSGRLDNQSRTKAELSLRRWLEEQGLSSSSLPESAGYDPPWTPGPLRRNEVLLRLDEAQ